MQDLVNTFAGAYKSGAAIRDDQEQQRLYEDTKNTFSSVMKEKDKYGGDEGALREAAKRFGESGNVNGFNMATKEAVAIRTDKEKIKQESLQHVGAAAVWLYGFSDEEDENGIRPKQEAYKKLYDHYSSIGVPMDQWPKPDNYTDEVGMSLAGVEGSRKFFDEVTYKKSMAEAAKTRAAKAGTGGKSGGITSVIQLSDYRTKNKFKKPDGTLYSKQENFDISTEIFLSAKKLSKATWIQKWAPVLGKKSALNMAEELPFDENKVAEKPTASTSTKSSLTPAQQKAFQILRDNPKNKEFSDDELKAAVQ